MSRPITHVALVVDRSGSMAPLVEATLSSFNKQLELMQERGKTQDIFTSMYLFSGDVKVPFTGVPAASLRPLTREDYVPNGSTAMYDAIRCAIEGLEKNTTATEDTAYLVLVFTDGEENASTLTTAKWLREKVTALQKTGKWTFTVLGANVSLDDLSDTLSIPLANMRVYMPTVGGVLTASTAMGAGFGNYFTMREQGGMNSTHFYDEDITNDTTR